VSGDGSNGVVGDMTVVVVLVVVVDDPSRKADDMNVEWPPPTTKPPSNSPFLKQFTGEISPKREIKIKLSKMMRFRRFLIARNKENYHLSRIFVFCFCV
jgi:hypothetical protein